jgi:hypothetical protein
VSRSGGSFVSGLSKAKDMLRTISTAGRTSDENRNFRFLVECFRRFNSKANT